MNKRKKLIYFAFTLSLLTVFSVVMFNLEAFEGKKEFLNKGNEVSAKKVVENASEDIKEKLYSKAVTEEMPTVEEKPNIVDNIVPNVKQVVSNNDNNNIKDNTITSPPEAKPAEKEEVPTIILEDSNVYVQELGEPKNELAMQVVTKDKNIEYGVDDSKVDYSKVGRYSVRFFARTFATNRQVEKVMPFAVVDTKAPTIAIVPERTVDAASSVAVRLNIKDPSAIKEKKYVWLNENEPIPADSDASWIPMKAEDQVVESKDFNPIKEGTLSIAVQAVDNTNNKATVKSQEYQISQHVPTDIVMQPSTTDFTNQDVNLTITYQNTPAYQKYKVQGQPWKDYTGAINITDNCYVYAQATNGNEIVKKVLNITNIDKKGPENIVIAPNIHFAQKKVEKYSIRECIFFDLFSKK
ncbi:MAG: hypothetical protein RR988_06215 [Clostridia bacterium]